MESKTINIQGSGNLDLFFAPGEYEVILTGFLPSYYNYTKEDYPMQKLSLSTVNIENNKLTMSEPQDILPASNLTEFVNGGVDLNIKYVLNIDYYAAIIPPNGIPLHEGLVATEVLTSKPFMYNFVEYT